MPKFPKPRLVRWGRSCEGSAESKCGRFDMEPLFMGTTRAQGFRLHDRRTGRHLDTDSQAEAKYEADEIIRKEGRS